MGSKSSPPPAPDPTATAEAQSKYNKDTAAYNTTLNRYDANTPFGSQTWNVSGTDPATGAPHYVQNINLTPEAQQALTNTQKTQSGLSELQQQGLQGVGQTLASNPFDRSQLPARPINAGQTAQDAIMSRLQPQMSLENQQFEADMANRGIAQGSDPYNQAHRSLSNSQNDRQIQAAATGINVGNDSRNQAIQEQGYYANAPLNYLNGLMTGSQVQTPQFQPTANAAAQTPNYEQAVQNQYQGQLAGYNANVGSQNAMMSGLFSLGGAALGAPASSLFGAALLGSDASIKQDIERVGTHPSGVGVYTFTYKPEYRDAWGHGPQMGVLAQEVQQVKPDAVTRHRDGYLMVDYRKL